MSTRTTPTTPTTHHGEGAATAAVASPLGTIVVEVRDGAVVGLAITDAPDDTPPGAGPGPGPGERTDPVLAAAVAQLEEYLAGRRRTFDLPLHLDGTPFQREVWAELQRIPYGDTISYAELARRVGRPQAHRAVGSANGRNPVAIVVPCHRVVATGGGLGGYAYGIGTKRWLLDLEAGVPPR